MAKKIVLSTLIGTLILFLWSGVTQMFPWGVPTAQAISAQSSKQTSSFQTPNLIELPAGTLTTAQFDDQMVGKISTLTTDKTFSWIISTPIAYYDVGSYFMKEVLTQLFVALLLSFMLWQMRQMPLSDRLKFIGFAGLLAVIGIYGQQINWWGMPLIYGLGAGVNLIIGWLLVAFVSSKWLIKTEK
jgi:hypothetical protein